MTKSWVEANLRSHANIVNKLNGPSKPYETSWTIHWVRSWVIIVRHIPLYPILSIDIQYIPVVTQ